MSVKGSLQDSRLSGATRMAWPSCSMREIAQQHENMIHISKQGSNDPIAACCLELLCRSMHRVLAASKVRSAAQKQRKMLGSPWVSHQIE